MIEHADYETFREVVASRMPLVEEIAEFPWTQRPHPDQNLNKLVNAYSRSATLFEHAHKSAKSPYWAIQQADRAIAHIMNRAATISYSLIVPGALVFPLSVIPLFATGWFLRGKALAAYTPSHQRKLVKLALDQGAEISYQAQEDLDDTIDSLYIGSKLVHEHVGGYIGHRAGLLVSKPGTIHPPRKYLTTDW